MAILHSSDAAYANVKGQCDQAAPGDTVIIPQDTKDWGTNTLTINNNIRIIGAGPGKTIITGVCNMITFVTKYVADAGTVTIPEVELGQMTLISTCNATPGGQIIFNGFSQNCRVHHIVWDGGASKIHIGSGWTCGVIDHCTPGPNILRYPNFTFGNPGVPKGLPHPTGYGTEVGTIAYTLRGPDIWANGQGWYVEDNVWNNPTAHWLGSVEPGGSILVARHNSTNSQTGLHGTDTTASTRCARSMEIYNNYYDIRASASIANTEYRGGSGNCFNNRYAQAAATGSGHGGQGGNIAIRANSYRTVSHYGSSNSDCVYTNADGAGIFDVNDRTTTPLFSGQSTYPVCNVSGDGVNATNKPCVPADGISGTIFAHGTGATVTGTYNNAVIRLPGLPAITANQLVGYVVRDTTTTQCANPNTLKTWGYITEHGAFAAGAAQLNYETSDAAGVHATLTLPSGNWEIRHCLNTLDEIGAGKAGFITNTPTANIPDVQTKPITIERDYLYQWGNYRKQNTTDSWATDAIAITFSAASGGAWDDVIHSVRGMRNGYRDVGYYNGLGTNVGGSGDVPYPGTFDNRYPSFSLSGLSQAQKDAIFRIGADAEAFAIYNAAGNPAFPHPMFIDPGDPAEATVGGPYPTANATSSTATRYPGFVYPHPLVSQTISNPTPSITSASTTTFTAGATGQSFQVTVRDFSGTPVTYAASSISGPGGTTSLPTNVSFSSGGLFSGTATSATAGTYTMTITASHSPDTPATQSFSLIVNVIAQAPTVSITAPSNGAVFTPTDLVTVSASANDPDGNVTQVEFFDGVTSIGVVTSVPYAVTKTFTAGSHTLTAKATDNSALVTTSSAVTITSQQGLPAAPSIAVISG